MAFFSSRFADLKLDTKIERAVREAAWIASLTRPGGRVLDLGCGRGRVSIELAKLGFSVVGMDINADYLAAAAARAAEQGVSIEWVLCDDRKLHQLPSFDTIVSMFTSFGYHDEVGNALVLANVWGALRPGGIFIIETHNGIYPGLKESRSESEFSPDGTRIVKHYSYDDATRMRTMKFNYECNGDGETASLTYRLFDKDELLQLLEDCGFSEFQLYGTSQGAPWDENDEKLVIVARRTP